MIDIFVHDDNKIGPPLQRIYESLFEAHKPVLGEELICELIDLTNKLNRKTSESLFYMMDGVNNSQFVFYRPENNEENEKQIKEQQTKKLNY